MKIVLRIEFCHRRPPCEAGLRPRVSFEKVIFEFLLATFPGTSMNIILSGSTIILIKLDIKLHLTIPGGGPIALD